MLSIVIFIIILLLLLLTLAIGNDLTQGPKWYNAWITAVQPNSCYSVTYIKPDNGSHTTVSTTLSPADTFTCQSIFAACTDCLRCVPLIDGIYHQQQVPDSYDPSVESEGTTYAFSTELTKAVAAVKLTHDSELDLSEANYLKTAVSDVAALNTKPQ
jgi:hypothetical protein